MGEFIAKLVVSGFVYPIGNIVLGALVSLVIGITIYQDQQSLIWVIFGLIIAGVGILRLIIEHARK